MATNAQHARSIHYLASTGSGIAIGRPTTVSAFSVDSVNADCIVNLRDGGSTGPILWSLEADNAASSPAIAFNPPIRFFTNVYIEFVVNGSQSSANIAVIEP